MATEQKPHKEHLPAVVEKKYRKREQARQERRKSIFFGLGMFGTVGWTIALPTVIGTFIGRWLDGLDLVNTRISWTLTGLFGGLCLGAAAAWRWVEREGGSRRGGSDAD